jgi:dihydrofolate reductase
MTTVRVHMSISLDGYTAGPNQSADKPFGENTEHLNDWMFALKSARDLFGMHGGETGPSDEVFKERASNIGAVIMGRNMFGGGTGGWGDGSWKGWWGPNPPYHCDVYVLTNHAREHLTMEGGTTFYFVTDGIEAAMQRARASAGDKDVVIGGGANVIRQYLNAGLLDELELHVAPIVIGGGEKLFEGVSGVTFEQIRCVPGTNVTHIKYSVTKS